ncbi:MAG: hypothetical protein SFV81_16390 [Pirellulaceae bacterium]|nr:hypothetical protein [Pirellulaceae bacterium]
MSVALVFIALVVLVRPVKQQGIRESLFWYLKMYPASKCDVVVAGDSRVLQGIDPASMKKAWGDSLQVINVGFRSAALERQYLDFARDLLKNDSKKVLLLGITANAFTPQSLTDNGYLEQKKMGSKRPYAIPAWCVLLERKFQPFSIRELVGLIRGRTKSGNYETFHESGWLEADLVPRNPEGAFALYRRRFDGNQASQATIDALIAQVKELVGEGIAIVGFEPPVPDEMQSIEDTHSGFDRGAFKEMFCRAGGIWLEIDRSRYLTVDGSHLAPESAQLLSQDLAADVRQALGWQAQGLQAQGLQAPGWKEELP